MSELSDELRDDPESLGYQKHIEAGDKSALRSLLNEPRTEQAGALRIPSSDLLIWAGQNGRLRSLETAADNDDGALGSIADAAVRMIQRDATELDLSRQEIRDMLDALVDADVLSDGDRQELLELSTAEISRAEELLGRRVSIADVRAAVEEL